MKQYRNTHGQLHRAVGPAVVSGNYSAWYINDRLHREDGPAVIDGSYSAWYINGVRHRTDGPAIVDDDYSMWYLHGSLVTEAEHDLYAFVNGNKVLGPAAVHAHLDE